MSTPTREELDRVRRELCKIRAERVLGYEELASLGDAIKLLDSYPLPPEDGAREELARMLDRLAGVRLPLEYIAECDLGAELARAAALLRQPPDWAAASLKGGS